VKISKSASAISGLILTSLFFACSSSSQSGGSSVKVTSLTPDHASARGGDTITIAGTGFGTSPEVRFGSQKAVVTSSTDSQIVVAAPRGVAGAVDIEVDVGSQVGRLGQSFTYEALPMTLVDLTWPKLAAFSMNGAGAATADANGDSAADIFEAAGVEGIWLYTNDKTGKFPAPTLIALPPSTDAQSLVAKDFDGDGKVDLFVGTGTQTANVLLLGDGKGRFTASTKLLPPLFGTSETVASADLDGDGDQDLVVVGAGVTAKDPPTVFVLANDGKGTFTDITKKLAGGTFAATGVAIGDVDGDGDLDLFFGADKDTSRLYINDGKATFQHASPDALPTSALGAGIPAMGDLDGNGSIDIYVPSSGQDHLLSNDGTGIFTDLTDLRLGQENAAGASATLCDFDLDGSLDAVVIDRSGQLHLYRNDASHRLFDYSDQVVGSEAGVSNASVAIADFDGDGDSDVFVSRPDLTRGALLVNASPMSLVDTDGDGVPDGVDDCPAVPDPSQDNADSLPMHCDSGSSCKTETGCTFYGHGASMYLVCPDAQSWSDAEAKCRVVDAHLATINDAAESAFVGSISGTEAWIGASDTTTAGTWAWTSGSTTFANWAAGQPDAGGDCVRMLPDGTWDNVPCANAIGYVCETARTKTPDPGDACDPCPLNYDPTSVPLVGDGSDAGTDTDVDGSVDGGPALVCKSAP